jgi:hypothetical protein
MGKRMIYELTGQPYRTDTELVTVIQNTRKSRKRDEAVLEMWSKFSRLVSKMKFKLIHTMNDFGMRLREDVEEYESRAFETFMNAVMKIRLEDCAHIPNWGAYIHLWGYLMTMNRDIVKHYLDNANTTTSIKSGSLYDSKSSEGESAATNLDVETSKHAIDVADAMDAQTKRAVFWDAYSDLEHVMSPKQRRLTKLRQSGLSQRDIRKTMGITTKQYEEETEKMRIAFANAIAKRSNRHLSYDELAEFFETAEG